MDNSIGEEQVGQPSGAALLAIAFITFGFLCVASIFLPHDPYLRYQQLSRTLQFRVEWIFDRIHHDTTPIDIALVGVSRTQAGISAPKTTNLLSGALGRKVEFANLSIPQQGRNAHYAIAKQLLEAHPETRILVLSLVEQMPRTPHPAFRNIAEAEDIIDAPSLINYEYVNDLAFLPWRQTALFAQGFDPEFFGGKSKFDPTGYAGTSLDSTLSYMSPTGSYIDRDRVVPEVDLQLQSRKYLNELVPARLPDEFVDYEFVVERLYLRKIEELARNKNVQLVYLYLPIYGGPRELLDEGYDPVSGPLLSAKFITQEPNWFSDYGHVNRNGSPKVTQWFSSQLVGLIERGELTLPPRESQGLR